MKRYFTQYWTNRTCADLSDSQVLDHAACNQFRQRGVSSGDALYIVTIREGRLILIGRMEVDQVCDSKRAAEVLGTDDLWDAEEHVIAAASTDRRFDREVPVEKTSQLRFINSGGPTPLVFSKPGFLDQQTLRSIRELEPTSARLLDELLPPDRAIDQSKVETASTSDPNALDIEVHRLLKAGLSAEPAGTEQPETELWEVERFVRCPKVVAWVRAEANGLCEACGASAPFVDAEGEPFLEVHHVKALADGGSDRPSNAVAVCPNCHRRFHHSADKAHASTDLYQRVARLRPE